MKKLLFFVFCALCALSVMAEEKFDMVYEASSMELPNASAGFSLGGYQTQNSNAGAFCGLMPTDDGETALYLGHNDPVRKWNSFYYRDVNADWQCITIDFKIAIIGESEKPQFSIGVNFKDMNRKNKNSYANVCLGKKVLQMGGTKPFEFGEGFRSFRMIADKVTNKYQLYDMDNGGKFINEFSVMHGTPQHKPCNISFGDGSSAVEGEVMLMYAKFAFDKKYIPNQK